MNREDERKMYHNRVDSDYLCPVSEVFAEDDKYMLSRYEKTDRDLYMQVWKESFEGTSVYEDEDFKQKLWKEVLSNSNKLQLKIINKKSKIYVGEIMLMNLVSDTPEIGIQILRKYQGQGIGTRVTKLFVDGLREVLDVEYYRVRIRSDNYISQKMFEKMGAVKIGTEGKEYAELMNKIMKQIGRDAFEEVITKEFEETQRYIICYKLEG